MTVNHIRYQYRIYPTPGQRIMLSRTFGCCRTVWNDAVRIFQEAYKAGEARPGFGAVTTAVTVTAKRTPERAWLGEVSCVPLQQTMRQLHTAFGAFFASLSGRRQGPKVGPPRFKKRAARQSAEFTQRGFRLRSNRKLYLAKIGEVKVAWSRDLPSEPSSVTVIKDAGGMRLGKSVHDQALGAFERVLAAKAARAGRTLVAVDRFFPSTQTCSACRARTGPRGKDELRIRAWQCTGCGAVHDRDVNAAINIKREGLRLIAENEQLAAGHRQARGNTGAESLNDCGGDTQDQHIAGSPRHPAPAGGTEARTHAAPESQ